MKSTEKRKEKMVTLVKTTTMMTKTKKMTHHQNWVKEVLKVMETVQQKGRSEESEFSLE